MPRLAPEVVQQRSDSAWARKRPWYGNWRECWRYAAPGVDPFASGNQPDFKRSWTDGGPRHEHLFDSTLADASDKHANMMMHEMFPAGRDWGEFEAGSGFAAEELPEARRKAIAKTQERVFSYIHASNFVLSGGSMVRDGVVSGTGVLKVGLAPDSATLLDFEAVNQATVALERGARDSVWGYYRKMQEAPSRMRVLWPQGADIPASETGQDGMERELEVVEATTYDPEDGLWRYMALLPTSEGAGMRVIFEREYVVSPWISWRYWLAPGEVQGRSRVMAALPDARTANKIVETGLRGGALRAAGIFMYRSGDVFNPATSVFEPGAFLQVGSNDSQNPTIAPLPLSGDPRDTSQKLEDTRASIRRTMLDESLPPPTAAVRSATEIVEMQRQALRHLGHPFVRLVEEAGRPILRAVAYLLQEANQLPELAAFQPAPASGRPAPLRLDGSDVKVRFSNPMTRSQRLTDAQTTVEWLDTSRAVAGPEAVEAAVKLEEVPELLSRKYGAPAELIREAAERNEMWEAAREARMAGAQAPQAGGPPQGMAMAA